MSQDPDSTISAAQAVRKEDTGCIHVLPDALMKTLKNPDDWELFFVKDGEKEQTWLRHKPSRIELRAYKEGEKQRINLQKFGPVKEANPYITINDEELKLIYDRVKVIERMSDSSQDEEIANKLLSSWINKGQ